VELRAIAISETSCTGRLGVPTAINEAFEHANDI
jgi:hypothetical protein